MFPVDLDGQAIAEALSARRIGRRVHVVDEVASTMDQAARLAADGAPDGTVVIADYQTCGRGRLDRRWLAPPGSALLLSILFRPALAAERLHELQMAVALGALAAVRARLPAGCPATLKWPNDILAGGDKLAGLLAESQIENGVAETVVVGLGLNVHQAPGDLPAGATSLRALGLRQRRDELAVALLLGVDERYAALLAGDSLLAEWSANLGMLGRTVTARTASGTLVGRALEVMPDGALIVEDADGRRMVLVAGDVTLAPGDGEAPASA